MINSIMLTALLLVLSLAACGGSSSNGSNDNSASNSSATAEDNGGSGSAQPAGERDEVEELFDVDMDDKWVTNEFTEQVPKPADEVKYALDDETSTLFQFVTPDNNDGIRAYIEQLKSAGFTENADELDNEQTGVIWYETDNAAGYHVRVHRNGFEEDWTFTIEKS